MVDMIDMFNSCINYTKQYIVYYMSQFICNIHTFITPASDSEKTIV